MRLFWIEKWKWNDIETVDEEEEPDDVTADNKYGFGAALCFRRENSKENAYVREEVSNESDEMEGV